MGNRHWTTVIMDELGIDQHLTPYEGSLEDFEEEITQSVRPRDYRTESIDIPFEHMDDSVPSLFDNMCLESGPIG